MSPNTSPCQKILVLNTIVSFDPFRLGGGGEVGSEIVFLESTNMYLNLVLIMIAENQYHVIGSQRGKVALIYRPQVKRLFPDQNRN